MFKIRIKAILFFMLLFTTVAYADATATIDTSQINKGILSVNYDSPSNKAAKVIVSKGSAKYTYDLKSKGQFPLQMGNGEYIVSVFENVTGNQYKNIKTEKVNLQVTNANATFLQSTDMINWNNDMQAIKKAKELTQNAKTDKEKATLIYKYISSNIQYDYKKASNVTAGYIPSIDATLNTSLGICFDYSVLYAAMLRSVGVPTKMIMGYKNDITEYHAWNEVYLSETNQWVTVDTTYDSTKVQRSIATSMAKNSNEYKSEKQY